ncbi:MAG: Rrf2 family transcriptional regulator [Pseudobdellovibrio sp.]
MRLTDHTDYSLRVLMYLNQNKKLVTLNELADKLGISKNNLIKVSKQLAKLKYIESTRGRSGGIWLSKETGAINLRTIVQQTEESLSISECFSNKKSHCTFLRGCLLKNGLNNALEAFLNSLAQITLNDITPK